MSQKATPSQESVQEDCKTETVSTDKNKTKTDISKELELIQTKLKTVSVSSNLQELLDADPELKKEYEQLKQVELLDKVTQQQEVFNRDNLALLQELLKGLQELTNRHSHHGEDDEEIEDMDESVHFVE